MRPGCISDASDRVKYMETIVLGELVKQAREEGVQAMIEGPGHVPLDEIEASVKTIKHITDFAPLYLLGPLVTDVAPGYDHFVSAIGGAVAGLYGADFLCMVSPSEHLALPSVSDIKEGTIVTKIAAHTADLVKEGQRERARYWDDEMAHARKNLDWKRQLEIAINSEEARRIRNSRPSESDACSICGGKKAITDIVKRTPQPIILIANDKRKMGQALQRNCKVIGFKRIDEHMIFRKVLKRISRAEGIEVEDKALYALIENANGDLRSAINDLHAISISKFGKSLISEGDKNGEGVFKKRIATIKRNQSMFSDFSLLSSHLPLFLLFLLQLLL